MHICPFCVSGFRKIKLPTKLYKSGFYEAVERCKTCNGAGSVKALPKTSDRRSSAAGQ